MTCSRVVSITLPSATMPSDQLSDHRVRLLANLPIWGHVVRMVQIEIVDIVPRDELLDIDRMPAFDGHRLEFILGYFDVTSLADLVAHHDVLGIDLIAGSSIKLAVFDA